MNMLERVFRKALRGGTEATAKGYCIRCQSYRKITDYTREYLPTGQLKIQGFCVVCRARISRLAKE